MLSLFSMISHSIHTLYSERCRFVSIPDNWFNESLKYTVTLKSKLPETFNPAKRRYVPCDDVPENNKTRVMEMRSRGPKWGDLINVRDPTHRYELAGSLITVGRDRRKFFLLLFFLPIWWVQSHSLYQRIWLTRLFIPSNTHLVATILVEGHKFISRARKCEAVYTVLY